MEFLLNKAIQKKFLIRKHSDTEIMGFSNEIQYSFNHGFEQHVKEYVLQRLKSPWCCYAVSMGVLPGVSFPLSM